MHHQSIEIPRDEHIAAAAEYENGPLAGGCLAQNLRQRLRIGDFHQGSGMRWNTKRREAAKVRIADKRIAGNTSVLFGSRHRGTQARAR
jgi:hypothetical protein